MGLGQPVARTRSFGEGPRLPLLLWSGIKDHVARSPDSALENLSKVKLPLLVEFISRRIASDQDQRPIPFDRLISGLGNDSMNDEARSAAFEGIGRALRGRRKVSMPPSWPDTLKKLDANKSAPYHTALAKLGVTFGQGIAIDQIRSMVTDGGVRKPNEGKPLHLSWKLKQLESLPWLGKSLVIEI